MPPAMASALIGILLYGGGTLASGPDGRLPHPLTPVPLTGLMAGFGLTGVATYLLVQAPRHRLRTLVFPGA